MEIEYYNKLIASGLKPTNMALPSGTKQDIKCLLCNGTFNAIPKAKMQKFNSHKIKGCPACVKNAQYAEVNESNIRKLKELGFSLHEEYIGLRKKIIVSNNNCGCGQRWSAEPLNLIQGVSFCKPCNDVRKADKFREFNDDRSDAAHVYRDDFAYYKFRVRLLTEENYKTYKPWINPNDYPRWKSGTNGGYHLDHIVPIKYCYMNDIPYEICADIQNLRIVPWKENAVKYSKMMLKENELPEIFQEYLTL